jgi:hypothetical protein
MLGIQFDAAKQPTISWNEPSFSHKAIPSYPEHDLSMEGYFQSEKYFADCAEDIRSVISFGSDLPKQDICSIHVRRGDYLGLQDYHPCPDANYYVSAVKYMESRGFEKFVICSDDMDYCRNHLASILPSGVNVSFSEMQSDLGDIALMRSCSAHIIANSSFSWWGAWLSNAENIIAPAKWFGAKGPQDSQDICPENWLRF